MKKYTMLLLIASFIFLAGCQKEHQDEKLEYVIKNDASIEVIYYEKFSVDQSVSTYDTLQLNMTGEQLLEYSVFEELINQAEQSTYDYTSIILGIPIGWYEVRISNNGVLNLGLRFRLIEDQQIKVEIYTIKDNKAVEKFTAQIESNQEIVNFMDYIQTNGIVHNIPEILWNGDNSSKLKSVRIRLRSAKHSDMLLVLSWMNVKTEYSYNDRKYAAEDVCIFISHASTSVSHLFVIEKESSPIGTAGYDVIDSKGIIDIKIYRKEMIQDHEANLILCMLLNHINQIYNITSFRRLVLDSDFFSKKLYLRNSFIKDEQDSLEIPISESTFKESHVYKLNGLEILVTESEKNTLNEFFQLALLWKSGTRPPSPKVLNIV